MKAGHFAVNLLPMSLSVWPCTREQPWISVGVGGVCEVQVESKKHCREAPKLSLGQLSYIVRLQL